jgi:hypothetical protein
MTRRINLTISDELSNMIEEHNTANPDTPLNLSRVFQDALLRRLNQK